MSNLYFNTVLSITIVILSFIIYFLISHSSKLENSLKNKFGKEHGQLRFVIIQRLSGVLLFGIIPVFIFFFCGFNLRNFGFIIKYDFLALITVIGIGSLLCLMNFFTAKAPANLAVYPQIRIKNWHCNILLISCLSWVAYLLAYEILFRGILLFSCYNEVGIYSSITINVLLYALVHLPKGAKEAIGSIPLGVVLCLISLHFGTFWAAFWIHCCLALSNEWFSIKYSSEINIVRN